MVFQRAVAIKTAEPWLGRPTIEAATYRRVSQAAAESEPRLAAFNLANLLQLLGKGEAAALAARLIEQARAQSEWDNQWCYVVRATLPHLPQELVGGPIYRGAMRLPHAPNNRLELVLNVAARCEGGARVAVLGAAVDLAPPLRWEVESLPMLLEVLPVARRRELIIDYLRTQTGERRARQLRCIDARAPWPAIEDRGSTLTVYGNGGSAGSQM